MNKHINLILVLMSLCVGGIIGLQLFWNYQAYRSSVKTFGQDTNALLRAAVEQEMDLRQQQLVNRVKTWLADSSLITITCDTKSRDSSTVFYIQDRHPARAGSKPLTLGITYFKQKLRHITPAAKAVLIRHVGERIVKADLQKGYVYYYTPRLGDSLQAAFNRSRVNLDTLAMLYRKELLAAGVPAAFTLNQSSPPAAFLTRPVNTDLRRPYQQALVQAGFARPDRYFFQTMKWVLGGSVLLIAITLLCFGYTAKTLLSQRQLARLKDNFINNMTHELNTPIASIQLTTEALQTFTYAPQVQQEYLAIISDQVQKLTRLTAQVLTTNRLMARPGLAKQRLELGALISQALGDMAPQARQLAARIHYQPPATPAWIQGDALSLVTALTNLVDNALKYSPAPAQITISLALTTRHVQIAVADQGPGIPEADRRRVFEPFFRLPTGNRHDVKGYGLGLSYVRQVMDQHRGRVRVEPNGSRGSVFILNLPRC